jgi:hypothetical protein
MPAIALRATTIKVPGSRVPLELRCSRAACAETVTLTITRRVTVHHGHHTTHRREHLRIGGTRYSAPAGGTVTAQVPLTGSGRAALRVARGRRLLVTATLTVGGGSNVTRTVTLPAKKSARHKPRRK